MSPEQGCDSSGAKPKRNAANHPSLGQASPLGPTSFLLRSEKEMEKEAQRGRRASRSAGEGADIALKTPSASLMGDSSFGVQSLEDTIGSVFSSDSGLTRTGSHSSEVSAEDRSEGATSKKTTARTPANSKTHATGRHTNSLERVPLQASHVGSPTSLKSSDSPFRTHRFRRGSAASSINVSQPITPLKVSPHPESVTPSTPRSASPKSFRLSDEEGSLADESNSQAVMSSTEDDDESRQASESMAQLVMPSLAMPERRPFTEHGKNMGRARIALVGPKGVGKTSFIQSVLRLSEHIVHVDPPSKSTFHSPRWVDGVPSQQTIQVTDVLASTRPYPSWWTGEQLRSSQSTKSLGSGILERNLAFVDTPGMQNEDDAQMLLEYFKASLDRTTTLDSLSESELFHLLSGEGGAQIDAVIYIFDPKPQPGNSGAGHSSGLGPVHDQLIQWLCTFTNFIPLIGHADMVSSEELSLRKTQIRQTLQPYSERMYHLISTDDLGSASPSRSTPRAQEPFAISSALGDDTDVIDASLLMSSQYVQPLVPSDLPQVINILLESTNIRKMRYLAALKIIEWRKTTRPQTRHRELGSPVLGSENTESVLEDSSKVLVPYGSASYHVSASPSLSGMSGLSYDGGQASTYALARLNEQSQPSEPFRQVRLAKWAQDLQRSLHNESRRYREMYAHRAAEGPATDDGELQDAQALVSTKEARRPARGRLGGDLGVIDPRDPLGVLAFGQAFGRHGLAVLQVAGSFGLLGAVALWVMRHWADVQEFVGLGQPTTIVQVTAVPPPARSLMGWLDDSNLRGLFSWGR